MNRVLKRTAISVTAVGLASLTRAGLVQLDAQPAGLANTDRTTNSAAQPSTAFEWATETVQILTGYADVASADSASDRTDSGSVAPDAGSTDSGSPAASGESGTQGGAVKEAIGASPVTNPFGDAGPSCIPIALPISGTNKCIDNPSEGGAILVYTKQAILLVSGMIGGIIVLMIIISGVQYIISMGNPTGIAGAKKRLTNAITALVIFIMAYAIINFLLPGGIAG